MKKNLIKKITCLAALGAVLAWAGGVSRAANVIDYQDKLNSGSSSPWWINGWGGQAAGSIGDLTVGNPPGSFNVYDYLPGSSPSSDQFVVLGWYSGSTFTDPAGGSTNLLLYTNIVFDVLWDTVNSTIGIDAFNTLPGDLWQVWTIGAANTWIVLGQVPIPDAASNGWVTVNLPINPSIAGIGVTWGLGFKKFTGTGHTGIATFWIDNIGLQRSTTPPPPPTLSIARSGIQGLNIYDDGNGGDRQNIATVVTNAGPDYSYAWVGNPTPVTYSVTIAQFPAASYNNYEAHIYIVPGRNITEIAPDWNEANALVLYINSHTNGSVVASLRYKLNNPGSNRYLLGSDTNIFGGSGSAVTNTIVAGYGGLLGTVTNASGAVGTWSITISGDINITLHAPDGSTSTMAFPQLSDAQAFAYPVTVFWGTQAGQYQDVVLSNVSITGSTNSLNVDLTQPLDPTKLVVRAANSSLIFTTPANAVYWLQWTLPDVGYVLQSASSLMGPWTSVVGAQVQTTNYLNTFATSGSITNGRNYNPPPMGVAYDFGNATASNTAWASGPTYDAGASSGSGSLELDWTWNYTANSNGPAVFTMDLFPSAVDCSGGTLSFDIRINSSSTAGVAGDYGYLTVISRDGNYVWNDTGYGSGLLTAAGGSVDNWGHVSIPLGTGAASTVRGLTFQFYNDADRAIDGPETIYIDNLKITASGAVGPTVYTVNGKHSVYITSPMLPSSGAGFFRLIKP